MRPSLFIFHNNRHPWEHLRSLVSLSPYVFSLLLRHSLCARGIFKTMVAIYTQARTQDNLKSQREQLVVSHHAGHERGLQTTEHQVVGVLTHVKQAVEAGD